MAGLSHLESEWATEETAGGKPAQDAFIDWIRDRLKKEIGQNSSGARDDLIQILERAKVSSMASMAGMMRAPPECWEGAGPPGPHGVKKMIQPGYLANLSSLAELARTEVISSTGMGPVAAAVAMQHPLGGFNLGGGYLGEIDEEANNRLKKRRREVAIGFFKNVGFVELPEYCRPQADFLIDLERTAACTHILSYTDLETALELFFVYDDKGQVLDSRALQLARRLNRKCTSPGIADFLLKRIAYCTFLLARKDITNKQLVHYLSFLCDLARRETWAVAMNYDTMRRQSIGRLADGWQYESCSNSTAFEDFYKLDRDQLSAARQATSMYAPPPGDGKGKGRDKGDTSPVKKGTPHGPDLAFSLLSVEQRKTYVKKCMEAKTCTIHLGLSKAHPDCGRGKDCPYSHKCILCGQDPATHKLPQCPKHTKKP